LKTYRDHENTKTRNKEKHEREVESQDLSPHAFGQKSNVKIHQQASTHPRHAHVVQDLRVMHWREMFDRLTRLSGFVFSRFRDFRGRIWRSKSSDMPSGP